MKSPTKIAKTPVDKAYSPATLAYLKDGSLPSGKDEVGPSEVLKELRAAARTLGRLVAPRVTTEVLDARLNALEEVVRSISESAKTAVASATSVESLVASAVEKALRTPLERLNRAEASSRDAVTSYNSKVDLLQKANADLTSKVSRLEAALKEVRQNLYMHTGGRLYHTDCETAWGAGISRERLNELHKSYAGDHNGYPLRYP